MPKHLLFAPSGGNREYFIFKAAKSRCSSLATSDLSYTHVKIVIYDCRYCQAQGEILAGTTLETLIMIVDKFLTSTTY